MSAKRVFSKCSENQSTNGSNKRIGLTYNRVARNLADIELAISEYTAQTISKPLFLNQTLVEKDKCLLSRLLERIQEKVEILEADLDDSIVKKIT